MTTTLSPTAGPKGRDRRAHTGSAFTRVLGACVALGLALLTWLGLFASPEDALMGDSVRIMYVHLPSAIIAQYGAFTTAAVASAVYLWKRRPFWDVLAGATAEIGVVFTALTLVTGSLWGRPTWGVYWVWDARLTSTALLLLLFIGYLAVRAIPAERHVRARRSAIVALVAYIDVPIVRYSVDWWRSLHQPATVSKLDPTLDGLMLFTLMTGIFVFLGLFVWLTVHRFRVEWLAQELDARGLEDAIAQRRAEGRGVMGS